MTETSIERRQRAMGALVGSIVGDVLGSPFTGAAPGAYRDRFPRPVLAGDGELAGDDPGRWTALSSAALRVAESLRDCGALDEDDLRARDVQGSPLTRTIPAALAFASAPESDTVDVAERLCLLTTSDPSVVAACVSLHLQLRDLLAGRGNLGESPSFSASLVQAIDGGGETGVTGSVAGALAGARWGIGAIPSRWSSPLHGPVDTPADSRYDVAGLRALALQIAGLPPEENIEDPAWPARGPHLVDPRGLYVADLNGAARSHETVTGAHVLTLSRMGDRPHQPHWRRVYLVDSADPADNLALDAVLDDVIDTITACMDRGDPVVVHCFAGESRTGLVLRAWLMQRDGLTEAEATAEAQELWPHLKTWNTAFTEALRRRERSGTVHA
jgi:Dual specificity phosphatase, catalytic domain/ADP-ribosylglycohydrolase